MRKLISFILLILALPFSVMFIGCSHKTKAWDVMDKVERMMTPKPDSALTLLSSIDKYGLGGDEEKARYALLMSMALDKNYIDTTTFDVLQPAIDYYSGNGTADERLRVLYYQGRIFQNRSDYDMAMQCFIKAEDLADKYNDTLTYANLLVAQGRLYAKSYQMIDFIRNNLSAAELYRIIDDSRRRLSSLIRALDGSIIVGNKHIADSIMAIVDPLVISNPETGNDLSFIKMAYGIKFGSPKEVRSILDSISDITHMGDESKLDIVMGFLKLRDFKKANDVFESIGSDSPVSGSLRYISIMPDVLEGNGKYRDALESYKVYHAKVESENANIYSQKTTVAQELHELKVDHFYTVQHKDKQLWIGLCVLLTLVIVLGVTYYQLRLGKIKCIISEKEQVRLQLANDNLQKLNSVLELEKHNVELECERQNLAAENLRLKISQLESEEEHLRELLKKSELSKPILDSIRERIEMVNGLLAAKIADNDSYSKPYDRWITQVTEDRKSFMASTRLAFCASHPAFMKYLEDHGLTESEQDYVCLYAIGLRGKEIGEYIQIKRHYHTSTDIRKKLELHEDDTNLGLHIRNLMKKL